MTENEQMQKIYDNVPNVFEAGRNSLKSDVANALKGRASGEVVALKDVSPLEHKIPVELSSKNLISYPYTETTKTMNGITFTDNGDGSVTVNGTATAEAYLYLVKNITLPVGQYALSGGNTSTELNCTKNGKRWMLNSGVGTFNEGDVISSISIYVGKGKTIDNITIYPQLESGAISSEYTQPFPDNTQVTVKIRGKNLIPYPYADTTKTTNGITLTDNGDGTITVNGTATANTVFTLSWKNPLCNLKANTYYTLSGCPSGGSDDTYSIRYSADPSGAISDIGNGSSKKFDTDIMHYQTVISIKSGTVCNNLVFKPQLEIGTTATAYEPYTEYETVTTTIADGAEFNSVAPNMTISTDTEGALVEVEYNRDINNAFEEIINAIISMGGNL